MRLSFVFQVENDGLPIIDMACAFNGDREFQVVVALDGEGQGVVLEFAEGDFVVLAAAMSHQDVAVELVDDHDDTVLFPVECGDLELPEFGGELDVEGGGDLRVGQGGLALHSDGSSGLVGIVASEQVDAGFLAGTQGQKGTERH